MDYGIISVKQLERIDRALKSGLIDGGVVCAILVDVAGNIIAGVDNGEVDFDVYSFATLAAGNYASVEAMSKLVGETEFSLLFQKGENVSIYFSRVSEAFLLITTFGKDVSLGFLRLKVAEAIERINLICHAKEKATKQVVASTEAQFEKEVVRY